MKNIINKIKSFGLDYYLAKIPNILWSYEKHPGKLSWQLWILRSNKTINVLKKKYSYIIREYSANDFSAYTKRDETKRVWTMWWQGEDKAPELVKMCIAAMRKNFSGDVIVISESNYKEYVKIPNYILRKVQSKQISFTHFSDIIRMCVLKMGGCWLDATVLPVNGIVDEIFQLSYYTGKHIYRKMECISYSEWCGFLLAGFENEIFFQFATDFFFEYWKKEDYLIDYFLIDYITRIALDCIPEFRRQYEQVPFNNPHLFKLESILEERFDPEQYNELIRNTSFFKLNWKTKHKKTDMTGGLTFYGYLVNKYLSG